MSIASLLQRLRIRRAARSTEGGGMRTRHRARVSRDIRAVLEFSNLASYLKGLDREYIKAVEAQSDLDGLTVSRLASIVAKYFTKDRFEDLIVAKVETEYMRQQVSHYLKYHRSRLYARVARLESSATNLSMNEIETFDFESLSPLRKKCISQLVVDFELPQQSADQSWCVLFPVLALAGTIQGKVQVVEPNAVRQHMLNRYLGKEWVGAVLRSTGLIYSDLSDRDLEEYAAYHTAAETRWIYVQLYAGLRETTLECLSQATLEASGILS
jgi:hypothetical protein